MFLFDLQTSGFWVCKNATSIADIETPEGGFASFPFGIAFT
jgi:hypothetical protein